MELRVLRYFLAVAKEESITAASESLHVTQPTLSRQLMEWRKNLGKNSLYVEIEKSPLQMKECSFVKEQRK